MAAEVNEVVNTFSRYSSEDIPRSLYDHLDLIIEWVI